MSLRTVRIDTLSWVRSMSVRGVGLALAAVAMVALLPEAVAACPVCFDSSDENRQAFLATTAFLSLLPLGMVAGAGLWIRRKTREQDELHQDEIYRDGHEPERETEA